MRHVIFHLPELLQDVVHERRHARWSTWQLN